MEGENILANQRDQMPVCMGGERYPQTYYTQIKGTPTPQQINKDI